MNKNFVNVLIGNVLHMDKPPCLAFKYSFSKEYVNFGWVTLDIP